MVEKLLGPEARSATALARESGVFGDLAFFSFNGNKIITTSGGGALVSDRKEWIDKARFLATQARDPAPHGSTPTSATTAAEQPAGGGRAGQLRMLDDRVEARRANNAFYRELLGGLPGITFMPEAPGCHSTFWLTCIQVDPEAFGASREDLRLALEEANIEARPVWKPMHLQPVFAQHPVVGGSVAEGLFENGLCLPSGSSISDEDRERVVEVMLRVAGGKGDWRCEIPPRASIGAKSCPGRRHLPWYRGLSTAIALLQGLEVGRWQCPRATGLPTYLVSDGPGPSES